MVHAILVHEPPKKLSWKIEVDGRELGEETEDEFVNRVADTFARGGKVYYMKTNFQEKKSSRYNYHPVRKKHFKDGYWMYTFWFTNQKGATLFKLFHGS